MKLPRSIRHVAAVLCVSLVGLSAPSSADAACVFPHNARPASRGYPLVMSSLYGAAIRTGAHPCFERVVIQFGGTGAPPGFRVEYKRDPVQLSPSDQTVSLRGNATLVINVASWMGNEGAFTGSQRRFPTNVTRITELRLIENFEGLHQWAVGLDRTRPFRVFRLSNPPRLVVDIGTG